MGLTDIGRGGGACVASGYQRPRSWLESRDSLQPEAPPERRRVASQAPALSPQQPPRQRAGCERIAVVLVHGSRAMPCNVGGAIAGALAWIATNDGPWYMGTHVEMRIGDAALHLATRVANRRRASHVDAWHVRTCTVDASHTRRRMARTILHGVGHGLTPGGTRACTGCVNGSRNC